MSDPFSDVANQGALGGIDSRVAETAAALSSLKVPASDAADAIDQAFAKAGQSLAKSLARAASDGKISLSELAKALLTAVEQAMGGGSRGGGLSTAISQAISNFSGARADGGPVSAGGGYLVGERGPEVFRPDTGGTIEPANGTPNVSINVMVTGGAQALVRSEAQVAAALNRAARMGVR